MKAKFTVNARLPGLNDYVHECRKNPYSGAQMKRIAQEICNIAAFGVKVIEDALVNLQILKDDGWKYIEGYSLDFGIDKARPRVEIEITDGEEK